MTEEEARATIMNAKNMAWGQQNRAVGNAAAAMGESQRIQPIQAALETLDQVIAHLEERAKQLAQRLAPIMVPQPQNTARGDEKSSPVPTRSHVAERIEVATTRLAALAQALDQVTHSLEI